MKANAKYLVYVANRACRQMNDKADRFLCTGCALAEFSK